METIYMYFILNLTRTAWKITFFKIYTLKDNDFVVLAKNHRFIASQIYFNLILSYIWTKSCKNHRKLQEKFNF